MDTINRNKLYKSVLSMMQSCLEEKEYNEVSLLIELMKIITEMPNETASINNWPKVNQDGVNWGEPTCKGNDFYYKNNRNTMGDGETSTRTIKI